MAIAEIRFADGVVKLLTSPVEDIRAFLLPSKDPVRLNLNMG